MATYAIEANGTSMGDYQGGTAAEALDAYAQDAGYKNYADLAEQHGNDAWAVLKSMILTKEQAEAIYSAMRSLNKVHMRIDCFAGTDAVHVREMPNGSIAVHADGKEMELYTNQSDFAAAYDL